MAKVHILNVNVHNNPEMKNYIARFIPGNTRGVNVNTWMNWSKRSGDHGWIDKLK